MGGFSISISGTDFVEQALDSTLEKLKEKVNDAIQGAGTDTESDAKQACPVDTGRLRGSITYTPGDLSCTVGTNVEYAPYVEFGHVTRSGSHVPAQPFLYPAFVNATEKLKDGLKDLL